VLTATEPVARSRADAYAQQLGSLAASYRNRPSLRVLYQIWDRPIYTIGGKHVITDALRLCGAENVFADLDTAAPAVTREAAVLRNPDLILVSAPPQAAAEWIAEWQRYPALGAVRDGKVVAYADDRMDRMGPSVIDAASSLCALIDRARRTSAGTPAGYPKP